MADSKKWRFSTPPILFTILKLRINEYKIQIFWEGLNWEKIFFKLCGLLRISELYLQQNLPEIGSVIPMKASSSRNMNKFESKMTSFHDLNTKDLETKVMKVQWLISTLATEATLKAWTLMLEIFVRDIFKEVMAEATAFSDTLVKLVLTKAKFWN